MSSHYDMTMSDVVSIIYATKTRNIQAIKVVIKYALVRFYNSALHRFV